MTFVESVMVPKFTILKTTDAGGEKKNQCKFWGFTINRVIFN